MTIINFIKKFIPSYLLSFYHLTLAYVANLLYARPSKKLIVVGVTGTNGKSSTVNLIGKILEAAGHKVVLSSTVNFKLGEQGWLNNLKMTMPGRFFLQRLLRLGVNAGCDFAVIESSSEGIIQHRQSGIHYDAMIFTNLTPEHIEAHGGFENYKQAKLEYFRHLKKLPYKVVKNQTIPKIIAANADDPYANEFTDFKVDKIVLFGQNSNAKIRASNIKHSQQGVSFTVNGVNFNLNLKGTFDVYNALAAIALASAFNIDLQTCKRALESVSVIPGRMELIELGQNFQVLVDYAPEPEGLKQMYGSVKNWKKNKIIHVLGSTGGGRDLARRKILGSIAAKNSDFVIVTNEDPYEDDPWQIIGDVAAGAAAAEKILDQNLYKIPDRRDAIRFALQSAQAEDLVIITGKGAEQKMAVKGGYIPWDDRRVVIEELDRILKR